MTGKCIKTAFIGTHGVGKTTLCFELAGSLKKLDYSVDIVKEVARECPLPINRATTFEAQSWILHTQCARELVAESRFEIVLCDRSVLDNYAYLVYRDGPKSELDLFIRKWIRTYHALIKVPIWQPPHFDGTRDTNCRFQQDIDLLIDEMLAEYALPCLHLAADEQEEWRSAILNYLQIPRKPQQKLALFVEREGTEKAVEIR